VKKKGQFAFIIFILCLVLLMVVVMVVILIKGKEEPIKQDTIPINVTKTYFNITIQSNARLQIFYTLSNETEVLVKGILFPDRIENYDRGIEANTSVILEGYSDEYYYGKKICKVTKNDFVCRVDLVAKAVGYTVFLSNESVVIEPFNLTLQSPVLVCFTERANVANVRVNLDLTATPDDLKSKVDFCYRIPFDVVNTTVVPIEIRRNPFVNDTDLLLVLVRDFERVGFKNVGDRGAGLLV
jgi:hypothetical protein